MLLHEVESCSDAASNRAASVLLCSAAGGLRVVTLTYPEVHLALLSRVGVYVGDGAEFRLRSTGRGFFAEFRWPGPRATLDVILLGVGDCFYLHHDINVFEFGFCPRESEVGEELLLRYAGQLGCPPGQESFAVLRFRGEELAYTLALFGPRTAKEWVLIRQLGS